MAIGGNPGPVVIDLPADVQRANIEIEKCMDYTDEAESETDYKAIAAALNKELQNASRPCLLIGNGVKQAGMAQRHTAVSRSAHHHIPGAFLLFPYRF